VDITTHPEGNAVRLAVTGEIDVATVGELESAIRDATIPVRTTTVVVDLADVSFCDSSGIAAFVCTQADAATRGTVVRVVNPRRNVQRVLEITCLYDALVNPPPL
jgi:anti-anti-sigma factor